MARYRELQSTYIYTRNMARYMQKQQNERITRQQWFIELICDPTLPLLFYCSPSVARIPLKVFFCSTVYPRYMDFPQAAANSKDSLLYRRYMTTEYPRKKTQRIPFGQHIFPLAHTLYYRVLLCTTEYYFVLQSNSLYYRALVCIREY